jgi:hypothetical protein
MAAEVKVIAPAFKQEMGDVKKLATDTLAVFKQVAADMKQTLGMYGDYAHELRDLNDEMRAELAKETNSPPRTEAGSGGESA